MRNWKNKADAIFVLDILPVAFELRKAVGGNGTTPVSHSVLQNEPACVITARYVMCVSTQPITDPSKQMNKEVLMRIKACVT